MKPAAFVGMAVMAVMVVCSGCEPDNPGNTTGDKTVTGITILRLPYRITYNGNAHAPSFERDAMLPYVGGDPRKLPAHNGYREGEFIENRDITALSTEDEPEKGNRLILHGFKARVHYQDGSRQDVEFPRDWGDMGNLGKDGGGMRFAWFPGKTWSFPATEYYITVTIDKVSARFDIPYYQLQAVLIDKDKTDELGPGLTVNGTISVYEYESETGTKGIRPAFGVIGYYERIGWREVPEKVRIEAPLAGDLARLVVYRGYTPLYPIDPLVYTLDPQTDTAAEPWPSSYIQSGIPVPENPVEIDPERLSLNTVRPYYSSSNIAIDINPAPERYADTYTIAP